MWPNRSREPVLFGGYRGYPSGLHPLRRVRVGKAALYFLAQGGVKTQP